MLLSVVSLVGLNILLQCVSIVFSSFATLLRCCSQIMDEPHESEFENLSSGSEADDEPIETPSPERLLEAIDFADLLQRTNPFPNCFQSARNPGITSPPQPVVTCDFDSLEILDFPSKLAAASGTYAMTVYSCIKRFVSLVSFRKQMLFQIRASPFSSVVIAR
jgi:hypothetical protein